MVFATRETPLQRRLRKDLQVLACRTQEPSNRVLDLIILTFARMTEHDVAALVDDILGRPILIAPGIPGGRLVVLSHRIGDTMAFQGSLHIAGRPFEWKFGGMDADHDKPLALVCLVELGHVGQRVDTVVAAIGPEIDQHHPAPQITDRERRRVEPFRDADEIRGRSAGAGYLKESAFVAGQYWRRQSGRGETSNCGENGSARLDHIKLLALQAEVSFRNELTKPGERDCVVLQKSAQRARYEE